MHTPSPAMPLISRKKVLAYKQEIHMQEKRVRGNNYQNPPHPQLYISLIQYLTMELSDHH